jgi:hypothetical protein
MNTEDLEDYLTTNVYVPYYELSDVNERINHLKNSIKNINKFNTSEITPEDYNKTIAYISSLLRYCYNLIIEELNKNIKSNNIQEAIRLLSIAKEYLKDPDFNLPEQGLYEEIEEWISELGGN